MGKFSGGHQKYFCDFFKLKNLRMAVGKIATIHEGVENNDSSKCVSVIETSASIIGISYENSEADCNDMVIVNLSNGVIIHFFAPFLPVTPQMSYQDGNTKKKFKESRWPFAGKMSRRLKGFSIGDKKMGVCLL